VLTIETGSAVAPAPLNYPVVRSLLETTPEVSVAADGRHSYTFRLTAEEVGAAQNAPQVDAPTPEGMAAGLTALAREAKEIGLDQASWAIGLAVQLIALG
jgi:hypothetical protein